MDTATRQFIRDKAAEEPGTYNELARLYEQRLWHQLTQELISVLERWTSRGDDADGSARGAAGAPPHPAPLELYQRFVRDFEGRLNPVSLVQIVLSVSRCAYAGDARGAVAFLRDAVGSGKAHVDASAPATLLYLSELLRLNLRLAAAGAAAETDGDGDGDASAGPASAPTAPAQAQQDAQSSDGSAASPLPSPAAPTPHRSALHEAKRLKERATLLAEGDEAAAAELDSSVLSAYYRALSEYYKVQGPPSEYFRSALAFLSYTPFDALQRDEQVQWALDVSVAALVGRDIYDFGQVLAHEAVQALAQLDGYAWLFRLLLAFRRGDIAEYKRLCDDPSVAAAMREHVVLTADAEYLAQKIRMLRLMELAAFEHTHDQRIAFDKIARECHVAADEVEFLLMKALSLGLVSGSVDEVARAVTITRVMPRAMDRDDAHQMVQRLRAWDASATRMLQLVERESADMLVQS